MIISILIPEFEDRYLLSKHTRKTGKPKYWIVNGQSLYNASLHFISRAKITEYFHNYLCKYIKEQITPIQIQHIKSNVGKELPYRLSISLDIYEIKRGKMPDIGNMWLWIKWFEDALQESGIIENDDPNYVIESGRKMYHWVSSIDQRKLVFTINFVKL